MAFRVLTSGLRLVTQAMTDPVVASDGVTYDRGSITEWMAQNDTSPVTGAALTNRCVQMGRGRECGNWLTGGWVDQRRVGGPKAGGWTKGETAREGVA